MTVVPILRIGWNLCVISSEFGNSNPIQLQINFQNIVPRNATSDIVISRYSIFLTNET